MHRYESFGDRHSPMALGRRCAARVAPLLGMMALAAAAARIASLSESHPHHHCCGHDGWDDRHEGESEHRRHRGRGGDGRRFRTEECERCGHHRHGD